MLNHIHHDRFFQLAVLVGAVSLMLAAVAASAHEHAGGHGDMKKAASPAAENVAHSVAMKAADGTNHGRVDLVDGPNGILAKVSLRDLPAGWHAIHVHQTGNCTGDNFTTAGGHAAPAEHQHGFLAEGGKHAGDMPNIWVHQDGTVKIHHFMPGVHLRKGDQALLDTDGAAVIVHAGADDYKSQPSGDAGDRLACGVIAEPRAATNTR